MEAQALLPLEGVHCHHRLRCYLRPVAARSVLLGQRQTHFVVQNHC